MVPALPITFFTPKITVTIRYMFLSKLCLLLLYAHTKPLICPLWMLVLAPTLSVL